MEPTPPQNGTHPKLGPHPSTLQVSKQYIFEPAIQAALKRLGTDEASEAQARLQGCNWINNVRKALGLPIKTFNTACVFYHKFRLSHPESDYDYRDAACAALFNACKVEDTLKKSREIICAAYNLRQPPGERLSPDNAIFDAQSRTILGLERLTLEAYRFDFRTRHPQKLTAKLAHALLPGVAAPTALAIAADLFRTFAPLKQTSATLAAAAVDLAARLHALPAPDYTAIDARWRLDRAHVLETVFDLLDLYTHHRAHTDVGPRYPLETFIDVRIGVNALAAEARYVRYTAPRPSPATPSEARANGAAGPSPKEGALRGAAAVAARGREGTVRFMLDPKQARVEGEVVRAYFGAEGKRD